MKKNGLGTVCPSSWANYALLTDTAAQSTVRNEQLEVRCISDDQADINTIAIRVHILGKHLTAGEMIIRKPVDNGRYCVCLAAQLQALGKSVFL